MEASNFTIREIPTSGLPRNFEPQEVTVIGCYSNDPMQNYIDGARNLKYVQLFEGTKSVNFDLNKQIDYEDYEEYERNVIPKRKEQNSKLVNILEWINLHEKEFLKSRPEFVMLRGLMEDIVTTAYRCCLSPDWRVGAMKKKGTIYLRKILTKEQLEPRPKSDKSKIKVSVLGCNFEKFVVTDEPNEEPDPSKKESQGSECHVVLRTKIGGHAILYSAKVDGVCAEEGYDLLEMNPKEQPDMLANCRLVEVKTCSTTQQNKLRHGGFRKNKSRGWWVPAALGGVSNFIIGYRDDITGLVRDIENIPVKELYRKYGSGWYGESGYKFFEDFLSEVKQRVVEDETVYIFSAHKYEQAGRGLKVNFEVPVEGSQYLLSNLL
ncbi:unnamed protein product [Allacma fusca]|uniref:Decapping nuclease n=1 Tax=Allacma fusca TaxID=39272 RepID=A0A8J2J2A4_9HEXA|nr:unnamed protein product [Allacma fusca]